MAIVECGINAVLYNKKPYVSSLNHLLRFKKQSTNHALVSGHLVIFAKSPVTKTCIRRLQIHLELWKGTNLGNITKWLRHSTTCILLDLAIDDPFSSGRLVYFAKPPYPKRRPLQIRTSHRPRCRYNKV
ncbi:hypothetical protein T02_14031 [Trichinella nativa]|uniref:Uncharacterized protein n=1 Tax=Trichinella nativa TaxID=6335 RepID=A0A0V1L5H1_9BILA|nr:hypothetical protein T02_14031 [Trichinella nativa]